MLSRACLRGFGLQSLPKRQAYQLARRTVTTDAASSHAEKEDVPDVSTIILSAGWHSADGYLQKDDEPFQVKLSEESFETYNLDPPPYTLNTTKKELKQMYNDMVSVR
jgi:pyruvate dehydrogenase E1 component alpha subunit